MQGSVAVFVKTPGFSSVKTRLAQGIGETDAVSFHLASAGAVAEVMQEAATLTGMKPFFAVAERDALASFHWQALPTLDQGEGGLGERLHAVYSALQQAYGYAILLGADAPQLESGDLLAAARWLSDPQSPRFSFGPAGDGGFWLFGGNRPLPQSVWLETPYSRKDTGGELLSRVSPQGEIQRLRGLNDADTEEDLRGILLELSRLEKPTPGQTGLADSLERFLRDRFTPDHSLETFLPDPKT